MSKTFNDTGMGRIIAWISARVFKKSEAVTTQTLGIDTTPSNNSSNLVTSGGVYNALSGKQAVLTFDTIPTENSTNPVTSGGIYNIIIENEEVTAAALNDLNTRLSNVEEIDEVPAQIQSDWSQSDNTQRDYIKNKPSTDTFVKSYPGATSKLATTTVPNVTSVGAASTWSFSMGTGDHTNALIISGGNGSAPTLGTAKTVATGSLAANGGGASVMTGLGTPTTGSAYVNYATMAGGGSN